MQLAEWKAKLSSLAENGLRKGNQQSKRVIQLAETFFGKHKKKTLAITAGLLLTVGVGASVDYYYESNILTVYHVLVNGNEVGVVNDPQIIHTWATAKLEEEKAKNGLTMTLADYITFTEETGFKAQYDNMSAISSLAKIADIKVEAVKIVVDGKVIGYAASQQDAEKVLDELKGKYGDTATQKGEKAVVASASLSKSAQGLKEVKFKEDVKLENDKVTAAEVLTEDKLAELLSKGTFKQVTHTVVEGDCIGCIAKAYGITSQDIYDNNPGITENTVLKLGQQINVTALRPLVTVQTVEEVENEENVSFTVQTRNNEQLPKGETKIIQEGKDGSKLVKYEIIKENGQVVERKVVDQQVLAQPVTKIIERGTKVIPSRGTGSFGWPARGYISSGFGMRWGRLHKGIDIAGSGSIRAADNGRVVSAGWDGDYGKCVVIDHGNGMETLYGHMRSISVSVGDVVAKGKTIGVMGSTGDSTGVHLHFEVHKNGRLQNPMRFLN